MVLKNNPDSANDIICKGFFRSINRTVQEEIEKSGEEVLKELEKEYVSKCPYFPNTIQYSQWSESHFKKIDKLTGILVSTGRSDLLEKFENLKKELEENRKKEMLDDFISSVKKEHNIDLSKESKEVVSYLMLLTSKVNRSSLSTIFS